MPTYSTTAKNAAVDAVNALVDGGSIVLLDGASVIATVALGSPAFAASSNGTAALNSVSTVQASAAGIVDSYEARNSGGGVEFSGSAGEGGANELVLAESTLQSGQDVTIDSLTHSAVA